MHIFQTLKFIYLFSTNVEKYFSGTILSHKYLFFHIMLLPKSTYAYIAKHKASSLYHLTEIF